jgi:hypothetical protein
MLLQVKLDLAFVLGNQMGKFFQPLIRSSHGETVQSNLAGNKSNAAGSPAPRVPVSDPQKPHINYSSIRPAILGF